MDQDAFPSSQRRGGCAIKKWREATETAQTGWSDRHTPDFAELTTIEASPYRARASRPARQLLLSCRATPALRGGELSCSFVNTIYVIQLMRPGGKPLDEGTHGSHQDEDDSESAYDGGSRW